MSAPSRTEHLAPVDVAGAVLAVAPLLTALPPPVRVVCDDAAAARLAGVTAALGLPPVTAVPSGDAAALGPFERVLSEYLTLTGALTGVLSGATAAVGTWAGDDLCAAVALARTRDFDGWAGREVIDAAGGARLPVYAAGDPARPAVVISSACGMPARLSEGWMRHLATDHFVVAWESRGLFDTDAPAGAFTGAVDVAAQAGDLLAVMDHFEIRKGHLLGLCGGAVVAVAAAARRPEAVTSLSLWHGDFDLGGDSPKTDHQRNLQALMAMAAQGLGPAASVHAVLAHAMLAVAPPRLAHLVVYPYTTPELLHLYCRLNGDIMATDLRPYLGQVTHRALVVTSEDDVTAHPDGSRVVAERLPDAALHVTPHGDHLSLFGADPALVDLAVRFISGGGTPVT